MSLSSSFLMPPSCCRGYPIPFEDVTDIFDMTFKKDWNKEFGDFTAGRSVDCVTPGCRGQIPPWRIYTKQVSGPSNVVLTFAICKFCKTRHECTMQCSCKDRFQNGHSCSLSALTVAEKFGEMVQETRALTADLIDLEEILKEQMGILTKQLTSYELRDAGLSKRLLEDFMKYFEINMDRLLDMLEKVICPDGFSLSKEDRCLGEILRRDILQELHSFDHHRWVVRLLNNSLGILSKQIGVDNLEGLEDGHGPERQETGYSDYV